MLLRKVLMISSVGWKMQIYGCDSPVSTRSVQLLVHLLKGILLQDSCL